LQSDDDRQGATGCTIIPFVQSSNKSSKKVVTHTVGGFVTVGAFKIVRTPRRPPKDDAPDALWLRLKPYPRLSKHRSEE
jgi:hypothetical protein